MLPILLMRAFFVLKKCIKMYKISKNMYKYVENHMKSSEICKFCKFQRFGAATIHSATVSEHPKSSKIQKNHQKFKKSKKITKNAKIQKKKRLRPGCLPPEVLYSKNKSKNVIKCISINEILI